MAKKQKTLPVFKGKTTQGKKYLDQHRYPKVATWGYETEFIKGYISTTNITVKDLVKKMVDMTNEK